MLTNYLNGRTARIPPHQYRPLLKDTRERGPATHPTRAKVAGGRPLPREGITVNTNKDEPSSGSGSSGPRKPAAEGKESFDEAVTEHLAAENTDSEKDRDSDQSDSSDQPALQEQDSEGNPAKTDNE